MLDMIESLRRQRRAGGDIVLLGLAGPGGDEGMARQFLRARRADPVSLVVALAGGNHVRVRFGDDHQNVMWMGQHIVKAGVKPIVSLGVISGPGHFWNGVDRPEARWPGRTDYGSERFIKLGPWLPGHDGVFHIVTMTPSPPVSSYSAGGHHRALRGPAPRAR